MKRNKILRFVSVMAVVFVAMCASTLFTSCGNDESDLHNAIEVNGNALKVRVLTVSELSGNVMITLSTVSGSGTNLSLGTLAFTIPTAQYGQTIKLDQANAFDWNIMGTYISGDNSNLLDAGSTLLIEKKSGEIYKVVFNLKKTENPQTVTKVVGSYEGKPGVQI